MKQNLDLNDLALFVQVVDAGSFSEASRRLGIPKTTISRRITKLEKQFSVALIQRNTHQFEVTHLGNKYYQYCLDMVHQVDRAQHFIEQYSQSKGELRISCPKEVLDLYVNNMLIEFLASHPNIELFVESTNRPVSVVKEQLDFAIRVYPYPLKNSDTVVRPLCPSQHYLVASPELVSEPLKDFAEIDKYPLLSRAKVEHQWRFEHQEQGEKRFHFSPKLACENLYLIQKAVLNGLGIAVLPDVVVQQDLAQERLKVISPAGWQVPRFMVYAEYNSRHSLQPCARALLDFLSEKFRLIATELAYE